MSFDDLLQYSDNDDSFIDIGPDAAQVVRPPLWLLVVAALAAFGSLSLFAVPSRAAAHVAGYVLGAVVVSMAVVAFRAVDRLRKLSPRYVDASIANELASAILAVGLILAVVHAYIFLSTVEVA